MRQVIITAVHLLLSIGIIGLVLLQRGKGADAGAGFGSGASGTVFGARGSSTFFSKTTAILASCFFVTSLGLAYMASHRVGASAPQSLLDKVTTTAPQPVTTLPLTTAPVTTPQPAPAGAPASAPATAPATTPATAPAGAPVNPAAPK